MLAVREEGAFLKNSPRAGGGGGVGGGGFVRPPRYTQAQKGGNNHVPGRRCGVWCVVCDVWCVVPHSLAHTRTQPHRNHPKPNGTTHSSTTHNSTTHNMRWLRLVGSLKL